nr:hypothetical protein [uncultured Dyadobacter sp.]
MSSKQNGEIITSSYNFEAKSRVSEKKLIGDYQDFYPGHSDIRVISYIEIASDLRMETLIDNSVMLSKLAYA